MEAPCPPRGLLEVTLQMTNTLWNKVRCNPEYLNKLGLQFFFKAYYHQQRPGASQNMTTTGDGMDRRYLLGDMKFDGRQFHFTTDVIESMGLQVPAIASYSVEGIMLSTSDSPSIDLGGFYAGSDWRVYKHYENQDPSACQGNTMFWANASAPKDVARCYEQTCTPTFHAAYPLRLQLLADVTLTSVSSNHVFLTVLKADGVKLLRPIYEIDFRGSAYDKVSCVPNDCRYPTEFQVSPGHCPPLQPQQFPFDRHPSSIKKRPGRDRSKPSLPPPPVIPAPGLPGEELPPPTPIPPPPPTTTTPTPQPPPASIPASTPPTVPSTSPPGGGEIIFQKPPEPTPQLSPGAIAGISIVTILLLSGLFGLIGYIVYKAKTKESQESGEGEEEGKTEAPGKPPSPPDTGLSRTTTTTTTNVGEEAEPIFTPPPVEAPSLSRTTTTTTQLSGAPPPTTEPVTGEESSPFNMPLFTSPTSSHYSGYVR